MRATFLAAAAVAALSGWTITTSTLEAKNTAQVPIAQARADQQANPSGLPDYLMRPNGLMINGLLPSNGWQG
jgi:hypothetical protein